MFEEYFIRIKRSWPSKDYSVDSVRAYEKALSDINAHNKFCKEAKKHGFHITGQRIFLDE